MKFLALLIAFIAMLSAPHATMEETDRYGLPVHSEAMSREDLIESLGVLSRDDTDRIVSYSNAREGNTLKLNIVFEIGTYYGGTDGYMEDWVLGDGIISDLDYDLDGDGEEELLLIYCRRDETRKHYPHLQGYVLIYESKEEGYVRSSVIPIDILAYGICERSVKLIEKDGRRQIALIRDEEWDGGGGAIRVEIYEYDGRDAMLTFIANAGVNCYSFAAFGPFDIEWRDRLEDSSSLFYGEIDTEDNTELHEGENYFRYDYKYIYENQSSENEIDYLAPESFDAFDAVAEQVRGLGIEMKHNTWIYHCSEDSAWEQYSLSEEDEGLTLLWVKEDAKKMDTCVDITLYTSLDHGE